MIRGSGQAKKTPGTPLPSCAEAAAGRARLGQGACHKSWLTHTPSSTRRNEQPPESRDLAAAAAAGGFYSSFPSRKRKQTGTRRPPLPARELTPSRASQLPAHLLPPPSCARLAALSGDRTPAHADTQAANFHTENSPSPPGPPGDSMPPASPLPSAHSGTLRLAAYLIT